jgi:uncharacterized protein YjiS (DUF1127 family)
MLCRVCPNGPIELTNHCKSCDQEPLHVNALRHQRLSPRNSTSPAIGSHQFSSWPGWTGLVSEWLRRSERNRQRAALRDLTDNRHLLDDLGLTRQQALGEADRPFWD